MRAKIMAAREVRRARAWKAPLNASDSKPRELDWKPYTISTLRNAVSTQMKQNRFLVSFSFLQGGRRGGGNVIATA